MNEPTHDKSSYRTVAFFFLARDCYIPIIPFHKTWGALARTSFKRPKKEPFLPVTGVVIGQYKLSLSPTSTVIAH